MNKETNMEIRIRLAKEAILELRNNKKAMKELNEWLKENERRIEERD